MKDDRLIKLSFWMNHYQSRRKIIKLFHNFECFDKITLNKAKIRGKMDFVLLIVEGEYLLTLLIKTIAPYIYFIDMGVCQPEARPRVEFSASFSVNLRQLYDYYHKLLMFLKPS